MELDLKTTRVIGPTDGEETIAQANDVFRHIHPNFKKYEMKGKPTKRTEVNVYKVKDRTPVQLFRDFGRPLEQLCLTQAQIKQFAKKQRGDALHIAYKAETLFLCNVGEKFIVVSVDTALEALPDNSDDVDVLSVNGYRLVDNFVIPCSPGSYNQVVIPKPVS